MRHRKKTLKLNRTSAHRKAMLSNLVTSLFLHEKIKTTVSKAKAAKSLVDKLISLAKKGDLSARRKAAKTVKEKKVLQKLFSDIAPRYTDVHGSCCRVIRSGRRAGDNAPMSILELIVPGTEEAEETPAKKSKKKAETPAQEKVEAKKESEQQVDESVNQEASTEEEKQEPEAAEVQEESKPEVQEEQKTEESEAAGEPAVPEEEDKK